MVKKRGDGALDSCNNGDHGHNTEYAEVCIALYMIYHAYIFWCLRRNLNGEGGDGEDSNCRCVNMRGKGIKSDRMTSWDDEHTTILPRIKLTCPNDETMRNKLFTFAIWTRDILFQRDALR